MINVKVNDNYRITSDNYQYILEEKYKSKKGEEKFKAIGYYSNFKDLSKSMLNREIKKSSCMSVLEIEKTIEKFAKDVANSIGAV